MKHHHTIITLTLGLIACIASTTPAHATGRTGTAPSAACTSRTTCASPFPVAAATCKSRVIATPEAIPANTTADHTQGDGAYNWGPDTTDPYWAAWASRAKLAQGATTGTTDELFQWAACRWGIRADLLRAVGVQETDWHQASVGDYCGTPGEGSYGIIQIKNAYCNGQLSWGGYPDTQRSTPLALDFYGAYLRACYDGVFYDGGSWLYNGQTVSQIAAAHGWSYVMWGCVGSWFSGGWYDSGAKSYIASVKQHLAARDWPSGS